MIRASILAAALAVTTALAGDVTVRVEGAGPDAVVWLSPVDASAPLRAAADAPVRIEQRDRRFVPRITVVQAGTEVDFPNLDKTRHHVYSFSDAKRFELKLYAGTPAEPVTFDTAGIVALGCNIHDDMAGFVVVVDTPWHGRVADGLARFAELPGGEYRVRTWSPRMAESYLEAGTIDVSAEAVDVETTVRLPETR